MSIVADPLAQTQVSVSAIDKPETPRNSAARPAYPAGARTANWFSLFNSLSWQITLGSPIILYAKRLGASATIVGLIAALMPLLVILQLPAARYLPRFGYRRFILAGWGSRTVMIFAISAIPLLGFASMATKLTALVVCLFMFNLLRGMASGAWMPWMSEIIPHDLRPRFLSRDQAFSQLGSIGAMIVSALALSGSPSAWQFSAVFFFSATAQTCSLWFLKRMPDVTAPEKLKRSGHRVPWMQMLMYPPFFRLMLFDLLYYGVIGGLAVFTITYLKTEAGYSESSVLWLSMLTFVGALISVPFVARIIERRGSKTVLGCCVLLLVFISIGWWLVASGTVGKSLPMFAAFCFFYGVATINWNVANNRLMMATMPAMGRNHFFALFIVLTNVGWGLAPILWGLLIDAVGRHEFVRGVIEFNRYSIYFVLALALAAITFLYTWFLHESRHEAETAPLAVEQGT